MSILQSLYRRGASFIVIPSIVKRCFFSKSVNQKGQYAAVEDSLSRGSTKINFSLLHRIHNTFPCPLSENCTQIKMVVTAKGPLCGGLVVAGTVVSLWVLFVGKNPSIETNIVMMKDVKAAEEGKITVINGPVTFGTK
jgi:hypothetical protein